MSTNRRPGLTDAQTEILAEMDDVSEHIAHEFDPDEYEGFSTCGFAHVHNISGNGTFYRRVKSLAESELSPNFVEGNRGVYHVNIGSMCLSITEAHDGGYRASLSVGEYIDGAEYQRMDVRERLHGLLLSRLKYHGYCEDAYVSSRMD